jgi:hypothetical protein
MSVLEGRLLDWQPPLSPEGGVYPVSREGQSAVYSQRLNGVILFGGLSEVRMNDLYLYTFADKKWKVIEAIGKAPVARSHHAFFLEKDSLFVYGGQNEKGRSLSDLYVLNLERFEWKRLFVMESPPARQQTSISITFERNINSSIKFQVWGSFKRNRCSQPFEEY